MNVRIAIFFAALAVAGCERTPSEAACNDFRVVTYYESHSDPDPSKWRLPLWYSGPDTSLLCIVKEEKISPREELAHD